MGKNRKKKKADGSLIPFLVLPMLAVNGYCLWRLNKLAAVLDIPVFGSFFDGITQITTIIMINSAVIILLVILKNH